MQENTLSPQMIRLYILMKAIKELTKEEGKSEAKSYHIKSAIVSKFKGTEINETDLGPSALALMNDREIRGTNCLYC